MRSALIIGANGQDGRLLADLLLRRGYRVRGWTRSPTAATDCECATVDLLRAHAVEREFRRLQPDEVYYLAAFHHSTEERIKLSETELLERSLEIHLVGLQNVLEAIKVTSRAARLFYAASSHVFGSPGTALQDEDTPLNPTSAYGISKTAGLRCCQLYREEDGVFAATGVLFNHESALRPPTFLSQKIVRGALRALREPTFKLVLGDLTARTDWGYAPDYVEAMFRILQLPDASDFVVATGEQHSVEEFAAIAFAEVGLDWRQHVKTDSSLLNKPALPLCGNAAKLRELTGWAPTQSFPEMVRRLVAEPKVALPGSAAPSLSQGPASSPPRMQRELGPPIEESQILPATGMSAA